MKWLLMLPILFVCGCSGGEFANKTYLLKCVDSSNYSIQTDGQWYRVLYPSGNVSNGVFRSYEEAVKKRDDLIEAARILYQNKYQKHEEWKTIKR